MTYSPNIGLLKSGHGRIGSDMKSISTKSNWPQLGDEGYEVEWCSEIPLIPGTTDGDLDKAKYHRKVVRTKAEAWKLAKEVYPRDAFSSVRISPVKFSDPYDMGIRHTFKWEYEDVDGDFYEGEPKQKGPR